MRYIISRVFQGFLALIGVSMITFFLPYLYTSPVSIAVQVLGRRANPKTVAQFMHDSGLDQPALVQYWHWLINFFHGNFGISYLKSAQFGMDVSVNTILSGTVWRSIWLTFIPTILAVIIAIPIGLTQAYRRNKIYDHSVSIFVYVLYSTPAVLVCILLQYYLAVKLKIGSVTIAANAVEIPPSRFPGFMVSHPTQFLLPFIAIIALSVGGLTRFMRGSALDTLVQDHVRTARAKGASPTRVLFRHVLRPSFIPMLQIIGLSIPGIIGGALIVENVFNYPGMGVLAVDSVGTGDFTVVMALTMIGAALTIAGNLLADLLTAVTDPRVRLLGRA
jgi:peptide/nickel transport system permease protein